MNGAQTDSIREQSTADGAIVFDARLLAQGARFDPDWFDAAFWRAQHGATPAGGRGGTIIARAPTPDAGEWAIRHYRRGGMAARLLGDRYFWRGASQTRSFAEFRLLRELAGRGFATPRPVAAHYARDGVFYRADLITQMIPGTRTLAQRIAARDLDEATLARVGAAIGRLHAAGVWHADLNAHNVLIDADQVWIIDFDRGRWRAPQRRWRLANLARLQRSCRKIARECAPPHQHDEDWLVRTILAGYERPFATNRQAHA